MDLFFDHTCNSDAENSDSNGTGITLDIPSRTAFTCSSNSCNRCVNASLTYSCLLLAVIRLYLKIGEMDIISHFWLHSTAFFIQICAVLRFFGDLRQKIVCVSFSFLKKIHAESSDAA